MFTKLCNWCKNKATGGKEKCCKNYHSANRVKKTTVYDMQLLAEEIDSRQYEPPTYDKDMSKFLFENGE